MGRWQLHPLHLYLVHSYLELDDPALPLEVEHFGHTTQQVGELARREAATMQAAGILVGDEIAPPLAEALTVLSTPYLWVDSLWFPEAGDQAMWRTVAVVTEGNRVVLGVQAPGESERFGGMLTVEVHEKVTLSQALLPTLPPAPPGNRGAATVPASSFRDEGREQASEQGGFLRPAQTSPATRSSSGDRQLALYRAIGEAQHVRVGQFAANMRDRGGRIRRSRVVKWFDNAEPDGRYLDHHARGDTGEWMYSATPADARRIGNTIEELVASVR
ncbi:ESX secretion-associated protein EspG [Haloactinomyces albus]|uniref:ESX secretion-associated protein EspG n=1 Tax=Haloactinomyces albus TaxID=1352928 RepID=UPI00286CB493|nr:ESX secretion-associated protein EspG [Haloactinomyces albus]